MFEMVRKLVGGPRTAIIAETHILVNIACADVMFIQGQLLLLVRAKNGHSWLAGNKTVYVLSASDSREISE